MLSRLASSVGDADDMGGDCALLRDLHLAQDYYFVKHLRQKIG
jgi:hypothetical protein